MTEAKLMDIDDKSEKSTKNTKDERAKSLIIHADQLPKEENEKFPKESTKPFSDIPIEELKLKLKKIKSDEMKDVRCIFNLIQFLHLF